MNFTSWVLVRIFFAINWRERAVRDRGAACCAPACHSVSPVGYCGAVREPPCLV